MNLKQRKAVRQALSQARLLTKTLEEANLDRDDDTTNQLVDALAIIRLIANQRIRSHCTKVQDKYEDMQQLAKGVRTRARNLLEVIDLEVLFPDN